MPCGMIRIRIKQWCQRRNSYVQADHLVNPAQIASVEFDPGIPPEQPPFAWLYWSDRTRSEITDPPSIDRLAELEQN